MFCAALTIQEQRPDLNELTLMSAIARKMSLHEQLEANHLHLLLTKLKDLQVYITEDVFSKESFTLSSNTSPKIEKKPFSTECNDPTKKKNPPPKTSSIQSRPEYKKISFNTK